MQFYRKLMHKNTFLLQPIFLVELAKREVMKVVNKIVTVERSLLESGLATLVSRLRGELVAVQEIIEKMGDTFEIFQDGENYSDDWNLIINTFLLMFYAVLLSCLKLYTRVTRSILRLISK